ncbi:MAG: glycosyltransferase family 4 protein [Candidatus Omnitrophota bacterium]
MKIVQTPVRFPPYIGGTEKVAFYLSKELIKKGHDVKVICADEPAVGSARIEGIDVCRLPFIGKVANSNITLALFNQLMKEDFDILHTHLPHPWSADISAIVAMLKNKPLFLTYHNDIFGRGINKFIANVYNFSALKFLLKKAHKIFITSDGYRQKSSFLKPFDNKIITAPLGVDLEEFRAVNLDEVKKENIIFFMSKLDKFHKYKGLDCLLASVRKAIKKVPLKLYIGGEGELIEYYKNIVKDYGLGDVVRFLGYLDDEQLIKNYNLCDIFVLPSISATQEGFGLVTLEAMACKKPVVVTDLVGVADDVKNSSAGIVVAPKDSDSLAQSLVYLIENDEERHLRGENAFRLVRQKYRWDKHVDIVEGEYLKIA